MTNLEGSRSIVIADENDTFSASLARALRELGFDVCLLGEYGEVKKVAGREKPFLVATELRVGSEWAFDAIDDIRAHSPGSRLAIVTAHPSVATAVRSVKLGFDAYLAKPVDAKILLDVAAGEQGSTQDQVPLDWPSLDRTIWEYIKQVFVAAGSMSEAARRLRLDRRSLRRMLAKYPPHR